MKMQDVQVGQQVLISGVASKLDGRRRQGGVVESVERLHGYAVVKAPSGDLYYTWPVKLTLIAQAARPRRRPPAKAAKHSA